MTNPRIIKRTAIDNIFDIVGWVLILAIWVFVIINYFGLPDIIPIHYNEIGQPDGFGCKGYIFALPVTATIIFVGLTILNSYPHLFYLPDKINRENAENQYMLAVQMIRYVKLFVVLVIGFVTYQTILYTGGTKEFVFWHLLLVSGIVFVSLIFFVLRVFKNKE